MTDSSLPIEFFKDEGSWQKFKDYCGYPNLGSTNAPEFAYLSGYWDTLAGYPSSRVYAYKEEFKMGREDALGDYDGQT